MDDATAERLEIGTTTVSILRSITRTGFLKRNGRPLMQRLADETVLLWDELDERRQEVALAGAEDLIERARRGHA